MATKSSLEPLQRAARCSVCLRCFKKPASFDCEHHICQSCIVQCWGRTACPQCRRWSRKRSREPSEGVLLLAELLRRFWLLAQLNLELCQKHQEPLKLFCEEDETPICVVCRESRVHRAHPVLPIDEAAQEYKEKVAIQMKALKERREKLKEFKEDLEGRSQADQDDVQTEKEKVESVFNQIHEFLEKIEQFLIIMLKEFDKEIDQKRDGDASKLSEEIDRIDALINEVEEKCQQPAGEFLQDIGAILNRCQNGQLPQLVEISSSPTDLKKKLGHFSLNNIVIKEALEKCQEIMNSEIEKAKSMETTAKKASITLDPSTAHPLCVVSEDKTSVKCGDMAQLLPNNPERFDSTPNLLGCEKFTSGIHYWEVEVGDGQNWALGVARESVERKGPVVCCPNQGIWALGLCGNEYKAFTSLETKLTLDYAPKKIQVFVHYERGWIAFFDADSMSLIFIFRSVKFYAEEIYPFFKVWGLNTELKMCQSASPTARRAPAAIGAAGDARGGRLGEKHTDVLQFFCEEDQTPICAHCDRSQEHRAHTIFHVERAARDYRPFLFIQERVQAQLEILKQEKNNLWSQKLTGEKKIQEYTEKVQAERKDIVTEFEHLHQFLKDQEERLLTQLEELDKDIEKQKDDMLTKLSEELSRLGDVITEMEMKCKQPASEFLQQTPDVPPRGLQDIKKNMTRCTAGQFQPSEEATSKLEERLELLSQKGVALKETVNRFQDNVTYTIERTDTVKSLNDKESPALDPDLSSALLPLDQRNAGDGGSRHRLPALHYVPDTPQRLDSRALVLGCDGFTSGRYFWELEVGDGEFWAVGVTRDPSKKKGMMDFSPEEGIWAVGLWKGQHWALTSPVTALSLSKHPKRIRVSLDYVGECVTFTDADTEDPIFTFPPASFNGTRAHPLLWVVGFPAQTVFLRRMGIKYPVGVHEMDIMSP
ncbi:uncharacterized protein LOC103060480 [Python bivittatus]|uniref:Uncharacterized protein LOC103060480 n=1 Tax=Python bivittatus TaxID=176946 RepID=A0A9F5JBZ5_PYTBI|nr:uncharacterized protein LOC103060480 [Python bivittatus]